MEAFQYQQHQSFILDSVYNNYFSNPPIEISPNIPPQNEDSPTRALDVAPLASLEKKRKQSDASFLNTEQSKGARESKSKKKNQNGGLKKSKAKDLKDKKETNEESSLGYIHVRARRGQATDSHSLAERVRRERISERMKQLQGLVPECDKVIGKALVLDEIINYVESLQNQVAFLSMKIASMNPILIDYGAGFEDYMTQPEEIVGISQPIPSVIQHGHIPPTAFEGEPASHQPVIYWQGGPHNLSGVREQWPEALD